ncbi:hypothetical protein P7C70_g7555, partial [Phenoliferia sp. Uapishka_3]
MPHSGSVAAANVSTASLDEPSSPLEDYHNDVFDPLRGRAYSAIASEPVFPLIQRVRSEVSSVIDTVLSYEQLKTPAINFSVVRPLSVKLSGSRPPAPLLYALLVNRMKFLAEADDDLAFAGVNTTRGDLCELLAIKLLSGTNQVDLFSVIFQILTPFALSIAYGTAPASLELLHVLTHNFNSFEGVEEDMFANEDPMDETDVKQLLSWGKDQSENVLSLAVFTKAKRFIRSSLVQQVISAIADGSISYRPEGGAHSLLNDDYKSKPVVEVYDWRKEPFLDHYRLRVPGKNFRLKLRAITNDRPPFHQPYEHDSNSSPSRACSPFSYLLSSVTRTSERVTLWETLFVLWSLGFCLDEFASVRENGISAYFFSAYNVMDFVFSLVFLSFLALRTSGLLAGNLDRSELAFDTLSLAGCVLFPRLGISLLRDNIVLLALSAMVREFILFMMLVALCSCGFLCSLYVLGLATGEWGVGRISWLMFKIWLGNSFLGFEAAQQFHPLFGPVLIADVFAWLPTVLSQTLLLTILISLLSNTFAKVQANAEVEILYQKALRTLERVKTDAMSSYIPPLNLAAFVILFTLRPFLSPRFFHKLNVVMIKTFNFPILLFLALATRIQHKSGYGRTALVITRRTKQAWDSLPRGIGWEGASDSLSKLFERELTERAIVVPGMEDPMINGESMKVKTSSATSAQPRAIGRVRTRNLPSAHARMGSLGSPLSKMFRVGEVPADGTTTSDFEAETKSISVDKGVVARLEAIEAALAILVGEIVKSTDRGESEKPPLTSLSGAVEENYAADD